MSQADAPQAPFQIFQASAGAGKTYLLVERYLLLALAPGAGFQSILAITFTNKATQEMKSRLLKRLDQLAREERVEEKQVQKLSQQLQLSPTQLAARAQQVLSQILHAYGAFSVSTIDSFNNRLVRSFSRDLGLSSQFEVTLDPYPLLEAAVDELLEQLHPETPLTSWLLNFGKEKHQEGKRASYRQLLLDAAEDLLRETTLPYLVKLSDWKLSHFQQVAQNLQKDCNREVSKIQEQALEEQNYLRKNQLEAALFYRAQLPKWLDIIAAGHLKWPSPILLNQIQGERDFFKKSSRESTDTLAPYQEEIRARIQKLLAAVEQALPLYVLKPELTSSLYHTAVMLALEQQLQAVIERSQQVPISRFTRLISEHLRNEPAPYLYERLGDRYRFFFIDEFQDTSRLQWQNLVPLINESLTQDPRHRVMLVGDVKQAIYRFRGGDVEQFIDLIQDRDDSHLAPGAQEPLYKRETERMENNFRSLPELVAFNNALFPFLSKQLESRDQQEVYDQARQTPQTKEAGGYVHMAWLSASSPIDAFRVAAVEKTFQQLTELRKRGYQWGQIAILCQKHKQIALLSQGLREWTDPLSGEAIPVNSERDQTLDNALALRGLVAFYRGRKEPKLREARLPWAEWLYRQLGPDEDAGTFLPERARESAPSTLTFLAGQFPGWHTSHFESLDLLEQLHYLLRFLQPSYRQDPLILRFLDEVSRLRERERADALTLLRWWEQSGYQLKVPTAADDALRLVTLHAAKGLEFPVVIMPFVGDSAQGAQRNWGWEVMPRQGEAEPLPVARLKHTSKIEDALPEGHWMAQRIRDYRLKEELDGLNRFYVGCTRAARELHLFCPEPPTGKDSSGVIKHLPRFLKAFAQENDILKEGETPVAHWNKPTEAPPVNPREEVEPLPDYPLRPWRQRLKVSDAAPAVWHEPAASDARQTGLKIHRLLAQIKSADELKPAIEKAKRMGEFQPDELAGLSEYLENLLLEPRLKPFFAPHAEVLTERALLSPDGYQKIPDRLVWQDQSVHLLDYKSGKEDPEHVEQIKNYAHLLREAGYSVGECLLVYLHQPPRTTRVSA